MDDLNHADLERYVADLSDGELLEFAARVTAWRVLMAGTEYDAARRLVIRALAAVSNAWRDRAWNVAYHYQGGNVPRGSKWEQVHERARALLSDGDAGRARKQVAAWARTVRLAA